ncbi:MAG: transporter [Bacteriovoracaceae bacterium]|nr:transporter [Bacteriovoracaceae bacterium]
MNRQQRAWIYYDVGHSAFATTILTAVFPVYLPTLLPKDGVHLSIGPLEWTTSALALWAYMVSLSVFITFLISPILGSWADEAGYKKRFLALFTVIGAIATVSLAFCQQWQMALLAFVFANIGYNAAFVFYNSLLSTVAPEEKERHKLSISGYAFGYISGGSTLAFNLLMIMKYEWFGFSSKQMGLQASFILVGVWWCLFLIPALLMIEEKATVSNSSFSGVFFRAKQILGTIKSLPSYPALFLFIISFAFFNEGIQTVISVATLFGKQTLKLPENTLIGTLLMVNILGLPFTLSMNFLNRILGAKKLLIASLLFWMFIVTYAQWMTTANEFWIMGAFVALVIGVSQALPRSIFASLIPHGRQAEFFSFFALSGKMTSSLGALFFGLVSDLTGNPRLALLSLSVFFVIGITVFSFVSIDPKKAAAIV